MKSIFPLVLIAATVGLFFFEVKPIYSEVSDLRAQSAQYDQALAMSQELGSLRDKLSAKLDSFLQADLDRLGHFLPQQLDTVRIILDVDGIGVRNGIKLNDLKVATDASQSASAASAPAAPAGFTNPKATTGQFQTVTVSFNFDSTYAQGVNFLKDAEQSLRLLDGASVKIKPLEGKTAGLYSFDVSFKTYWVNR